MSKANVIMVIAAALLGGVIATLGHARAETQPAWDRDLVRQLVRAEEEQQRALQELVRSQEQQTRALQELVRAVERIKN